MPLFLERERERERERVSARILSNEALCNMCHESVIQQLRLCHILLRLNQAQRFWIVIAPFMDDYN